jgi:calcineurin-like phosphoesterase family protein
MNIYFTADTHFGHNKILEWQSGTRPFKTIEEHDDTLIDNINSIVKPKDTLYHLGDFAWKASRVAHYRHRIKCRNIILIKGNHEAKGYKKLNEIFSGVYDLKKIKVNGQEIVLCHYAMRVWNKSHYGVWHLYGHSHGSLRDNGQSLSLDVGVDSWGLAPVSFDQIQATMESRVWTAVDHHLKPNTVKILEKCSSDLTNSIHLRD